MQTQIQNKASQPITKITRAAMETELGDCYKRCWAVAFKNAKDELDFDKQMDELIKEFDLLRPQAQWFINGANAILFKDETKQNRNIDKQFKEQPNEKQSSLIGFGDDRRVKGQENYVSQLELMSFLEDLDQMCGDIDFKQFWQQLNQIRQTVLEQYCATEREVLSIFKIRSIVQSQKEQEERFFDAYPISTDAWENGYFDYKGEVVY